MPEGVLISYEGIEESGKTTHSKRLYRFLSQKKLPVLWTFEPGGNPHLDLIRKTLLEEVPDLPIYCELMLFLADRSYHYSRVIRPHLEKPGIVICDRYVDSTVAYQGFGRGVDLNLIRELNSRVVYDRLPDLTILIDISGELAARRLDISQSRDRIEAENIAFFERVRKGYLMEAERCKDRFLVLDGVGPLIANEVKAQERALAVLRARGWDI
ncbi:MAG: dTMP kinase [bacterium JZ-2024 1]